MRSSSLPRRRADGFTLIELLVTMTIIAILAALTLNIAGGVQEQAARKRTITELQAIQTAIDSYKVDNGTPPAATDPSTLPTAKNSIVANPSDPKYKTGAQLLFYSLTGRAGFKTIPPANTVSYLPIKRGSVGNPDSTSTTNGAADGSFLADAFGNPYGYYYNPDWATLTEAADNTNNRGFYDLWSTAKRTTSADKDVQAWITNWKAN